MKNPLEVYEQQVEEGRRDIEEMRLRFLERERKREQARLIAGLVGVAMMLIGFGGFLWMWLLQ